MTRDRETVLVTGASSGIGEALAWRAAADGHDLILAARSSDKLEALAQAIKLKHETAVAVHPVDLSVPGSAAQLWRFVADTGLRVDLLVNNAGVMQHGAFTAMEATDHQAMIQLNIAGFTDLLAHFLPPMVARGHGRILNVASVAAFQPIPSLATYAATKAYVLSLSEALSEELRGSGVSVTTLCPGFTATNMVAQAQAGSEVLRKLPAALISDVEDVADEAWRGCKKGRTIIVPGGLNQFTTVAGRTLPKWLLRRVAGAFGRRSI